jgi:hypothetical protein
MWGREHHKPLQQTLCRPTPQAVGWRDAEALLFHAPTPLTVVASKVTVPGIGHAGFRALSIIRVLPVAALDIAPIIRYTKVPY